LPATQIIDLQPAPPPLQAINDCSAQTLDLLQRWLELSEIDRRSFSALAHEIESASTLVETSTVDLCDRFQSLVATAQSQAQRVNAIIDVTTSITIDGKPIPLDKALNSIEDALQSAIGTILYVSKHAMRMVYALEDIAKDVAGAERCATQIEQINVQARYLALNATIEASRSGKAGAAFAVIAQEMTDLSKATESTAHQVRERISSVVRGVSSGHLVLKEIATLDLSENILAKEKIDKLMHALMRQSAEIHDILENTSSLSTKIATNIADIITSMQFQDRTKQHLAQVVQTLWALHQRTEFLQKETLAIYPHLEEYKTIAPEQLRHIIDQQTLGEMKQRLLIQLLTGYNLTESAGSSAAPGEVELF